MLNSEQKRSFIFSFFTLNQMLTFIMYMYWIIWLTKNNENDEDGKNGKHAEGSCFDLKMMIKIL